MKHLLIFLILASLLAASCQKEASSELPENRNPDSTGTIDSTDKETPDGNKLARSVIQYALDDSTYTDHFYDAAGRWIGHQMIGDGPVYSNEAELNVTRDANGIITAYESKQTDGNGQEVSSEYRLYYDAAAKRYTSKVATIDWDGSEAVDSTVYEYNAHNLIEKIRLFIKIDPQEPYEELRQVTLVYSSNGNLSMFRDYLRDSEKPGKFDAVTEVTFSYDDQKNPLILGIEAILMDQLFYASPNNVVSVTSKDLINNDPAETVVEFLYNYHASGRPKSGTMTLDGDEAEVFLRYK